MKLAFNFAYLGHIQVAVLERNAVPELLKAQAVVSADTLDTGETKCTTFFDPAKKRRERKIDTQGGILQKVAMNARQFGKLLAPTREVFFLRILADAFARRLVQKLALIEQAVINQSQSVKCCV